MFLKLCIMILCLGLFGLILHNERTNRNRISEPMFNKLHFDKTEDTDTIHMYQDLLV